VDRTGPRHGGGQTAILAKHGLTPGAAVGRGIGRHRAPCDNRRGRGPVAQLDRASPS